MTQPQVRGLADQINFLGDNGNATALQISDVVTRIGPLGAVAGLASGQIAALGSTVVGMGVEQEIAATGIKNTMLALTKGEAATKAQQKAYAALGLEAGAVARAMQVDAGGTILDVMTRLSNLDPSRQAAVMTQLFGSESVAAIAPMMSQLDVLKTNLRAVGDASQYAGSMDAEFRNRMSGAKSGVEETKNSIRAMAVELGSTFLPQIKAGSAALKGAAIGVRDFAKAHPGVIKVVGTLMAVLAGALLIFGGLAMAVAAVLGPFALLGLAFAHAAPVLGGLVNVLKFARLAMLGFNFALLANPITWIIVGVVALAAAAFLIYRNWTPISAWFGRLWEGVKNGVGSAIGAIGRTIMRFSPLGAIVRNWSGITNVISEVWSAVRAGVGSALAGVGSLILNFTPLGFFIKNWRPIFGFFGALFDAAKAVVGLGMDGIRLLIARYNPLGLIARSWSGITGAIAGVWSAVRAGVSAALSAVGSLILNFTPLGFVIRNWSGITGAIGNVWSAVRSGVSAALGAVGSLILNFTPLGFVIRNWSGITGFIGGVWDRAKALVTSGVDGMRALIAAFNPLGAFQTAFASAFAWLGNLPGRMMNAGADAIRGFTQGINGQRAAVQAATAAAAGGAETAARQELDTHSPSRVFARIGSDVMAGLSSGISGGAGRSVLAMRTATAALAAAGTTFGGPALASTGPEPTFERGTRLVRPDDRPSAAAQASSAGQVGPPSIGSVTIMISQQPGQDAQALAREVARILQSPNLAQLGDQGSDSHGETH